MTRTRTTPAAAVALAMAIHMAACVAGETPGQSGSGSGSVGSATGGAGGTVSGTASGGRTGAGTDAAGETGAGGAAGATGGGPGSSSSGGSAGAPLGEIVPLFDPTTKLEREVHFDRGDAIVTRWADRGRDRHAREDQFQSYDHYLPHYWEYRTARYRLVDKVAKGGSTIELSWVTEW
ncbi:MAG TPA: hypothetical protein VGF45_14110, partial [Polyangia bacterium]